MPVAEILHSFFLSIFSISDSLKPSTGSSLAKKFSASSARMAYLHFHYSSRQSTYRQPLPQNLHHLSSAKLTTGGLNLAGSSRNLFIASPIFFDPSTTCPALPSPMYSRIDRTWSPVGVSSVTLSSQSARAVLLWCEWSDAWSSVAVAADCADSCLSRVSARVEDWREGRWKRVMMSRVLCYKKVVD